MEKNKKEAAPEVPVQEQPNDKQIRTKKVIGKLLEVEIFPI